MVEGPDRGRLDGGALSGATKGRTQLRQLLTIDELKARDLRAYNAFMDFTEAQPMFWQLSVGPDGDLRAEDYQMDARVQWIAEIGLWQ
jgi:hypothetical protein